MARINGPLSIFLLGLALLPFSGLSVLAVDTDDETLRALEDVERSLSRVEQRTRDLDTELQAIDQDVRRLQQDLVRKADAIRILEREKTTLEQRLTQLLQTEGELAVRLERNREGFADVLFALQRIARHPPEALLAQPTDPIETVRSGILLRSTVPEIEKRAGLIRGEMETLSRTRAEINERQVALAQTAATLEVERQDLDRLIAVKRQLQRETEQQRDIQERRVRDLAQQAESLRDLVDRLARLDEGFRAIIEPVPDRQIRDGASTLSAAIPPRKPQIVSRDVAKETVGDLEAAPKGVEEARLETANIRLRPFSDRKGRLPLPVVGRVQGRFGEKLVSGLTRKGVTIMTRPGAQVVAPHEGRVVYAGQFRGYGLLLILEHGDGYHTLLAGMARIDGQLGQLVLAGEPVGVMDEAEKADDPSLYVEFRRKGEPINPMPWLAASTRKVNG